MAHKPSNSLSQKKSGKKPYDPPQIISRETLESVAAVCTGTNSKSEGALDSSGLLLCGEEFGTVTS
jgi:hypothetical protein